MRTEIDVPGHGIARLVPIKGMSDYANMNVYECDDGLKVRISEGSQKTFQIFLKGKTTKKYKTIEEALEAFELLS